MRAGRKPEPRIVDPHTYPLEEVCLTTAARFLGMDPRTLRRRIECGHLTARHDEKFYRVSVKALVAYKQYHTDAGTDAA